MSDGSALPDFYPAICRVQALSVYDPDFTFVAVSGLSYPPLGPVKGIFNSDRDMHSHPYLRIVFRPMTYHFSETIEIVRPMHLLGAGGYSTIGTVFKFFENKRGIIVHVSRGGLIIIKLLRDEAGNLILSDGMALSGETTSVSSYNLPTYLDRSAMGDLFQKPVAQGGFGWTEYNFKNTYGINSIIEGINLKGGSPGNYDIFPDMQIITTDPNVVSFDNTEFSLFDPYENHSRTCDVSGTIPIPFDLKLFA